MGLGISGLGLLCVVLVDQDPFLQTRAIKWDPTNMSSTIWAQANPQIYFKEILP